MRPSHFCYIINWYLIKYAGVMELVDVTDSKSVGGNIVWVRVPPPAPVESLDAQYACGAFFFAYASVLAPKCPLFCLRQTPGRARSRYALRVFSVTQCTSRVLAGIFLSPVDSVTLDAIRIGFSVIFIFQSRFKVYLFHSPNTAER